MNRFLFFMILALVATTGCREEFDIELKPSDRSLLVVEGILNAGTGPTTIRLTKTQSLTEAVQIVPVLNAGVEVESEGGDVYPLVETGNGNYTHAQLPLVTGQEYRLRIEAGGKEYLSDYVAVRQTPEIDSLTWEKTADGLYVKVNSHDDNNNTRYYKWEFDETWEIRSYYSAMYQYTGGADIVPTQAPHNYRCWKYASSTTINIATTAQLQSDVINEIPLLFIPNGSEKMSVRYSALVKQQSLTKAAYEYFQLMKKNTESLGSIFDPQPSELKGNIRCVTDPLEGVIGYVTAADIKEKRIFITAAEANWSYSEYCPSIEVDNKADSILAWVPSYLPYSAQEVTPGVVDFYYMAPAFCVDCTQRGGNLAMPSYW